MSGDYDWQQPRFIQEEEEWFSPGQTCWLHGQTLRKLISLYPDHFWHYGRRTYDYKVIRIWQLPEGLVYLVKWYRPEEDVLS